MVNKIRLGMIGGGSGAMIGAIHRHAARLDNHYELVAGVFSKDVHKSFLLAQELGLNPKRIYPSYREMFNEEANDSFGERMEVVSIVTPNDSHFEIANAALQAGFHVVIDKPLTVSLSQAKLLEEKVAQSKKLLCVTYVFCGYPMVKEAKEWIAMGKLGEVRKVIANFSQGWLATHLENKHHPQASWRMDPKRNLSGTVADIGTHVFHLAEYVTGLSTTHICADVHTVVRGRLLDDDSTILLKFANGAQGVLIASQIAAGEEANVQLQIYGERGSLHWQHSDANTLLIKWLDQPAQILRAGSDNHYLSDAARSHCRTPAGHPEGYIEAFANHYRNFAFSLNATKNNLPFDPLWEDYPKITAGVRGVAFVESVVASGKAREKWIRFDVAHE